MIDDSTPINGDRGLRICMITCPFGKIKRRNALMYNAIRVLEPLADKLFIISHNLPEDMVSSPKVHVRNVKYDSQRQPIPIRILKHVLLQLRISLELIKISRSVHVVIFYIGSRSYLLPTLLAKLLSKKIVSRISGSASMSAKELYAKTIFGCGGSILFHVLKYMEEINCRFADRIVVESKSQIREFGLERYEHKIRLTNCFFNTDLFKPIQDFSNRKNLIGFIGRLSQEKGALNFVQAIPLILSRRQNTEFLIGGDGQLRERIENELVGGKLSEKVHLAGWIPHGQLIHYYNNLKVLVVPSYSESIPIVALEAMACGTPVLATPVGGVPDVIRDEENGFILKDNSPLCIADAVTKALEHPSLEEIARAAYAFVESGFTYQAATERYRIILNNLVN
jgi:glycosyltransferase involved in cell wall biosynthesis